MLELVSELTVPSGVVAEPRYICVPPVALRFRNGAVAVPVKTGLAIGA
jgi:hypothetical protein